jgi:hypothetical protein
VAAVAALLLILFLFRPAVYQLRNRIADSIGRALGRRVALDNVRLHFLPRPSFDLEGLVIYDDPAFSAEPMIRAQEVSAAIRFRSLLRGRLEIATLSASEPSINLVRNNEGHWNLASLLERNAQIPAAPTGKPASEPRPAFPYLEASSARVNFKLGQTKKSYALMDADVALWQDSDNSWGARIKAEPVRTDFNLTDTGLLQINATWQRALSLRSTPMQVAVQWQKGQFGQITKLLTGKDRGWRGRVSFTANLSGTLEALRIESQAAIEGFHRYDIAGSENVRLATVCSGRYNAITITLADLLCESPVSGGAFRLRGTFAMVENQPIYDLTLAVDKVPLTSVVRLLRQAKKQIPSSLTASGLLNAEFRATRRIPTDGGATGVSRVPPGRDARLSTARPDLLQHSLQTWTGQTWGGQTWTGTGAATNVRLSSNAGNAGNERKDEVAFGTVPLALVVANSQGASQRGRPGHPGTQEQERGEEPAAPHLRIGPVTLALNGSAPVNAGGWMSAAGYRFFLRGEVELKDLFRLENVLGLPVARPAAEGSAKLDVNVSGPWQGFAPAVTAGTAQLRNVRAGMHGLYTPIEITSAAITLTPDTASMQKISARTGSTHWSGGVTTPRHCAAPGGASNIVPGVAQACLFQFDLTADQLSTGDLAEWFTPHPAKRPWYRILNSNSNKPLSSSPLLAIQAHGILRVGQLGLKKVFATQVATQVEVDRGKINLTALRGQLLKGTHQGNWTIDASSHDASAHDASAQTLRYHGTGTLHDISLEQLGSLMNDAWIAGTGDGKFDVQGSGSSFGELLAHADGKLQFVMRNGSLPHIEIPGSPVPLPVHRFAGDLRLKKGAWELSAGRLESRDGLYRVSGTASPGSGLDFVLTRGDGQSWALTGTLAKPKVAPEAERTEADSKTVKP